MAEVVSDGAADALTVVRILQNPLGAEAPPGERGDVVRVSDGTTRIYLLPGEYEATSPTTLRWMLAQQRRTSPDVTGSA